MLNPLFKKQIRIFNSVEFTLNDLMDATNLNTFSENIVPSKKSLDFLEELYSERFVFRISLPLEKSFNGMAPNRMFLSVSFLDLVGYGGFTFDLLENCSRKPRFLKLVDTWLANLIEENLARIEDQSRHELFKIFFKELFSVLIEENFWQMRSSTRGVGCRPMNVSDLRFAANWISREINGLSKVRVKSLKRNFRFTYPDGVGMTRSWRVFEIIGNVAKSKALLRKEFNPRKYSPSRSLISIVEARRQGLEDLSMDMKISLFGEAF